MTDYPFIKDDLCDQWRKRHHLIIWTVWKPFRNEDHFRRVTDRTLHLVHKRSGHINWDDDYREDDGGVEVVEGIIDLVIHREFPQTNTDNLLVRAAVRFIAVSIINDLKNESRRSGSKPGEKAEQWLKTIPNLVE